MAKVSLSQIKNILCAALNAESDVIASENINIFQQHIWNSECEANPEQLELLNDLALDLEYFDPNEKSEPFFNRKKLNTEIESALQKLKMPKDDPL